MVIISGSNENTGFKIKSVQACSIVEANNGYSYKFGVDGDIRTSKLDIGDAVINNSLFSEYLKQKKLIDVSKKNVSFDFVNIKFDYGINVGVNTEKDSNSDGSKNKKKIVVDENGNAVAPMSYTELRKQFYKDGVTIHWKIYDKDGNEIPDKEKIITYRMLMRNPGKAKEGECIFVKESIYKKVLNFLTMDLWDKMPEENAKIVEMSAYCTLITGTAIDFITIPMKNIFVLEDETVTVSKKALTVKVDKVKHDKETEVNDFEAFDKIVNQQNLTFYKKKASENPELTYIGRTAAELKKHGIELSSCPKKKRNISYTREECVVDRSDEKQEIPNVLWDGMGLIDDSIFPADMEGFIYCRSHFFKSCLFRGSIQQYFKDFYGADYDTAYATDMFGRKMKVKDIKVIVTNNSLKWLKFQEMMNKIGDKKYTPF